MPLTDATMRTMLLEHMEDHAPKLKARLRAEGELEPWLEIQVKAARDMMTWCLASVPAGDLAGEAMAREHAIATLLEYPREIDAL